jgi:phospholipid/cholesterol/gamma-HCH transport system ATP-binding protein
MKEPLIELRGVSKRFGDNVILEGLDLTIYRGEALVIIRPIGNGKIDGFTGNCGINGDKCREKFVLKVNCVRDC